MSLSNTATPKYYGRFRQAVIDKKIPVCETVSLEMNRIDALIANRGIYYDEDAVERWVRFCESELTLETGEDLNLLDTFKLWGEQIFGWYYFEDRSIYEPFKNKPGGRYVSKKIKKRLINKVFLIIARGNAKTLFLSCIHAYFLVCDSSTTDQICVAPVMKQADEVLSVLRTALIRARGPIFQFMTEGSLQNTTGPKADRCKLASTKQGIQNFITNSIIRVLPMDREKLQGLKSSIATVDEWLSCDIREDTIGAIEQGASKKDDYLIVATSSEGTVRNSVGDTIKMELMDILKGKYYNPHVSIWYYKLDDEKEVANPDLWIKACPNIGLTVKYETYQRDVEKATHVPSELNDILAKRFGIAREGFTYFFTYEETMPRKRQDFWQMQCSMGVDLSSGDDFTSFTFLFPLNNGGFGVKNRSYISSLTLSKLQTAQRLKYDKFIKEGSLHILDCNYLDIQEVYDDLDEYINRCHYDVRAVGYDPWGSEEFINRWSKENGQRGIECVKQGAKTESIPLGELKTLAGERMLYFDQEIIQYTMGNCIVLQDSNGNKKLWKKKRSTKIDAISALLDAWVAYKLNKEDF